ncbi:unnamed protein product [Toxocara canis]|uniref:Uncharacterized protein n=1 Tax=Toxocara canis TaxID=6265 RepID=A0A183TWW6_TOXCA|nr:unnamed protein product [Toxocara canis]
MPLFSMSSDCTVMQGGTRVVGSSAEPYVLGSTNSLLMMRIDDKCCPDRGGSSSSDSEEVKAIMHTNADENSDV